MTDPSAVRTKLAAALRGIGTVLVRHPFASLCDLFFVNFALWTVVWQLSYLAGGTLEQALALGCVVALLSAVVLSFNRSDPVPSSAMKESGDHALLLVFIVLAVAMTLLVHRPDADDEQYIGLAVALVLEPAAPVLSLPAFELGTEHGRYAISIYNPMSAGVSYLTGIPVLYVYYWVLPAAFAALFVIVHWRLLRLLVGEAWPLGLLFLLVVMGAWGDVHRTQANFGLVRMFQGKAVFVSVVVPAILFYFLKLTKGSGVKYDLGLLTTAVIAGVGATPTGLAVAPLLVGVLVLASLRKEAAGRALIALLPLVLVAVPLGYFMWRHYEHLGSHVHIGAGRFAQSTTNLEMYMLTMGDGVRGVFLFGAAALSFLVVKDIVMRRVLRNYVAIFLVLFAIPWTSALLAQSAYATLSWRWLWMLPIPALASAFVAGVTARLRWISMPLPVGAASGHAGGKGKKKLGSVLAALLYASIALGFIAVSPRRVISEENNAAIRLPGFKLEEERIYLRAFDAIAEIRDGRLYLEGREPGL